MPTIAFAQQAEPIHCGVHIVEVAECAECFQTSKTDPDRNLAIGLRLKALPELSELYFGGAGGTCQEIEVF